MIPESFQLWSGNSPTVTFAVASDMKTNENVPLAVLANARVESRSSRAKRHSAASMLTVEAHCTRGRADYSGTLLWDHLKTLHKT